MKEKPSYFSTWETLKELRIILFIGCLFTVLVGQDTSRQNIYIDRIKESKNIYKELDLDPSNFADYYSINRLWGETAEDYYLLHEDDSSLVYYIKVEKLNAMYPELLSASEFPDYKIFFKIADLNLILGSDIYFAREIDPLTGKYQKINEKGEGYIRKAIDYYLKAYNSGWHYHKEYFSSPDEVWLREIAILSEIVKVAVNYNIKEYELGLDYLDQIEKLNLLHGPPEIDSTTKYIRFRYMDQYTVYTYRSNIYIQMGLYERSIEMINKALILWEDEITQTIDSLFENKYTTNSPDFLITEAIEMTNQNNDYDTGVALFRQIFNNYDLYQFDDFFLALNFSKIFIENPMIPPDTLSKYCGLLLDHIRDNDRFINENIWLSKVCFLGALFGINRLDNNKKLIEKSKTVFQLIKSRESDALFDGKSLDTKGIGPLLDIIIPLFLDHSRKKETLLDIAKLDSIYNKIVLLTGDTYQYYHFQFLLALMQEKALIYNNIAHNQSDEAIFYFDKALQIYLEVYNLRQKHNINIDIINEVSNLSQIGAMYTEMGDYENAQLYLEKALTLVNDHKNNLTNDRQKFGFINIIASKTWIHKLLVKLYFETNKERKAFALIENLKNESLFNYYETISLANKSPLESRLSTLIALNFQNSDQVEYFSQSTDQLYNDSLKINYMKPIDIDAINELLNDQDANLVEYYLAGEKLVIWFLNGENFYSYKTKTRGDSLVSLLNEYDKSFYIREPVDYYSKKFYDILIAPFKDHINKKNLYIVPGYIINTIQFSCLIDSNNSYFSDSYNISYLPSASTIKKISNNTKLKEKSLLAFGSPLFNTDDVFLAELQHSRKEIKDIGKNYQSKTILIDYNATEEAFKLNAISFSNIHFATHAKVDPIIPLNSKLYLTPTSNEDGELNLHEIIGMNIKADLVVLSACDTGQEFGVSENFLSFAKGFLNSGVNSVVASSWIVDDESTALLMKEYYKNLKYFNKSEALSKAQKQLRKKYAHPYYWAGFSLYGSIY